MKILCGYRRDLPKLALIPITILGITPKIIRDGWPRLKRDPWFSIYCWNDAVPLVQVGGAGYIISNNQGPFVVARAIQVCYIAMNIFYGINRNKKKKEKELFSQ